MNTLFKNCNITFSRYYENTKIHERCTAQQDSYTRNEKEPAEPSHHLSNIRIKSSEPILKTEIRNLKKRCRKKDKKSSSHHRKVICMGCFKSVFCWQKITPAKLVADFYSSFILNHSYHFSF